MKINQMVHGKLVYKSLWFLLLVLSGCASKPKFRGSGDFCGFVIDEKNNAVENYVISIKKGTGTWKTTATNRQGMFKFTEMPFGEYSFKGYKNCYVNLMEKKYAFHDLSKVFCLQVNSVDEALNNVEQMIICENYDEANRLLDEIQLERKSAAKRVVDIYKSYIKEKKSDIRKERNEK